MDQHHILRSGLSVHIDLLREPGFKDIDFGGHLGLFHRNRQLLFRSKFSDPKDQDGAVGYLQSIE